jgi:hypothetical protein
MYLVCYGEFLQSNRTTTLLLLFIHIVALSAG